MTKAAAWWTEQTDGVGKWWQRSTLASTSNTHRCTLYKYSQMHPAQTPTCAHLTNTQRYKDTRAKYTHKRITEPNHLKDTKKFTWRTALQDPFAKVFCTLLAEYFPLSQSICRAPKVFAVLPKYLQCSQSIGNGAGRSRCNEIRAVSCGAAQETHTTQIWTQIHLSTMGTNTQWYSYNTCFFFSDEIENDLHIYTNRAVRPYHSPSRRVSGWLWVLLFFSTDSEGGGAKSLKSWTFCKGNT